MLSYLMIYLFKITGNDQNSVILNLDDEKFSSFKEFKKAYLVPLGSFFRYLF